MDSVAARNPLAQVRFLVAHGGGVAVPGEYQGFLRQAEDAFLNGFNDGGEIRIGPSRSTRAALEHRVAAEQHAVIADLGSVEDHGTGGVPGGVQHGQCRRTRDDVLVVLERFRLGAVREHLAPQLRSSGCI